MSAKERIINQIISLLPDRLKNDKELQDILEKVKTSIIRSTNIEVVKDAQGNIKWVKDTLSGLWFPVDVFPKAKTDLGIRPQHKDLLSHKNKFNNAIKKQIISIQEKAINGEIDIQVAKRQIETLKAKEWNVQQAIKELGLDRVGRRDRPAI